MAGHRGLAIYVALVVLAAAIFTLFPQIDLWAAGLFYRGSFFLSDEPVLRFVYRAVYWVTDALAILLPLALIVIILRQRPLFGLDRGAAIFLIVALAVGPGIAVNTVLKDHWGRARPSQVVEFGGGRQFTPALEPSDQCDHNCSFPAGHPATAFYFLSFALLIPAARTRWIVFASAIAAGAAVGAVRMAQGAHFLSDVVFSGLIVFGISWLLHDIIVHRGFRNLSDAQRLIAIGVICLLAGAVSYFFYDRQVAAVAHAFGPQPRAVAGFVTQFGQSDGYLIGSALVFAVCFFGWRRWREWAWRAAFVFINVAISGLAVDLLKWIFGRARPKLYFSDHLYGFTWFARHADQWSFPSGHAATAAALGLSLTTIWPRLWPIWWLATLAIMASRLVLDVHYLSDIVGGFYVALATWWLTRDWLARRELQLRGSLQSP